jgi:hypothetical protein
MIGMKHGLRFAICLLSAALVLFAVVAIQSPHTVKSPVARKPLDNNPDKFHLVATNSTYNYGFTYDPRAADEWLFHGGPGLNTNHP